MKGTPCARWDGTERRWRRLVADSEGRFQDRALRGGWAFANFESPDERVLLLEARGHRHVRVNGVPRGGDLYDLGTVRLPILVRQGHNELLFRGGRGVLEARLALPPAPVYFESLDRTLPDAVRGESDPLLVGLVVTNATRRWLRGLSVVSRPGDPRAVSVGAEPLAPLSRRQVAALIQADPAAGEAELHAPLALLDADGGVLAETEVRLVVREPGELQVRTYLSPVDRSVQAWAVRPPSEPPPDGERIGIVLTLHGAGVDARRQAGCYAPRPGVAFVAPTNRRPFGFDWEVWGRRDALDVLDEATRLLDADPARTWLTGHSMGGHGTWNLGGQCFPRFAAIAPSAGWIDFWSYAGAPRALDPTPVEALLARAANPSRTTLFERNWLLGGVYVLHGDADDNVPVQEARAMRARLGRFHPDFAYYESPGAGHWWGNQCMDWPPLVDFLLRHRIPADHRSPHVEFVTASPRICSRARWVAIEDQLRPLAPSRVVADLDPRARRITATTENVTRLAFELADWVREAEGAAPPLAADAPLEVVLDGETLGPQPWPGAGTRLGFRREEGGAWRREDRPPAGWRGPARYGPFQQVFDRAVVLVAGTLGTPEEDAWALSRARLDAEVFAYRGNGAPPIELDVDFDFEANRDRNVVLYGNADTNACWARLLGDSPLQVRTGEATVGRRRFAGLDLVALLVRPRPGSEVALVGAIAPTGPVGARAGERLPLFVSGVAYPDWTLLSAEFLDRGSAGVLGCGYWRSDWSFAPNDCAWRDEQP